MVRHSLYVLLLALLGSPGGSVAQSASAAKSPEGSSATSDYSKQAVVVEALRVAARFESDGRATQQFTTRIRVQSEAGVLRLGLLSFGYNTAFERINIAYLRVIKPDGTTIAAAADSIQDLPSEIQRFAPEYTDFRQKNVNVPSLRPGDLLEYSVTTETLTPMVPGQFSAAYSFERSSIVLDEEIELNLPADRKVKLKFSPETQPQLRDDPGRKIYLWHHSNTTLLDDTQDEAEEAKPADIQVSTFQEWSEVARWYGELQRPQVTISDAIKSKAADLTAGMKTEDERIAAIYNYVATNIRYVSISLGIGRFQPHDATSVLRNQYGDCKDKHTLLTALLAAAGVKAEPVLINTAAKMDPDVPSPFQFNHLITAIVRGDSYLYADTTTEVAPLGYLFDMLRNKQALLVSDLGAKLIRTPATLPVENFERIEVDAHIDESGDMRADVTATARGDSELLWRAALRRTPEAQWPQLLKLTLATVGLEGDIADVSASNLADTRKPVEAKCHLAKKDYVNWGARIKALDLPIAKLNLRPAATPEQKKGPIKQQDHYVAERRLQIAVPAGVRLDLLVSSSQKEDFAEFEAKYELDKNNVFHAERVYRMKLSEIPRSRYKDFNRLYNDVDVDESQTAHFELSEKFAASVEQSLKEAETSSTGKTADELFVDANKALVSARYDEAQDLLEKVTLQDPKNADAFVLLGRLYYQRWPSDKHFAEKAVEAYRSAVSINPRHQTAWLQMGMALFILGKYNEAAEAFRKQLEITPLQKGIYGLLGSCLMNAHHPAEAIPVLEKGVAESPNDSYYSVTLAQAYVQTGELDKAMLTLEALLKIKPGALTRMRAAGMLAEEGASLDWAEQQIQQVLNSAYDSLQAVRPEFIGESDVRRTWKIAEMWDTAGWVYFRRGEMEKAHKYLEASWSWQPSTVAGDRLAQLYSKEGKTDDALRIWAQALSIATADHPEVRLRFERAAGDHGVAEEMIRSHHLDDQQMRTIGIPNPSKLSGSAEMYVLIGPGPNIENVSIAEGDEKLMKFATELKKAKIELTFPDKRAIHLVRSGVLSCTSSESKCVFIFKPQPAVMRYTSDEF